MKWDVKGRAKLVPVKKRKSGDANPASFREQMQLLLGSMPNAGRHLRQRLIDIGMEIETTSCCL
jgi:hypothetical protein